MGAQVYASGRKRGCLDDDPDLNVTHRRAVDRGEPEGGGRAVCSRQNRSVLVEVAVNNWREQFVDGPLVGTVLFGLIQPRVRSTMCL